MQASYSITDWQAGALWGTSVAVLATLSQDCIVQDFLRTNLDSHVEGILISFPLKVPKSQLVADLEICWRVNVNSRPS